MSVIKYKGTDNQWHLLDNIMVSTISVTQTSGTSSADVMSQSAVTETVSGITETVKSHTNDINTLNGEAEITARALTDLNSRTNEIEAHTANTSIHFSGNEKRNLDSLATNIGAISGFTSDDVLILETMTRRSMRNFTSSGFTAFKNALIGAIDDMSLEKHGLKVGDYITTSHTISSSAVSFTYIIAGFNIAKGWDNNNGHRLEFDHIGIIVSTSKTVPWNKGGQVSASTNHTLSTGGTWTTGSGSCYANSDLHYYLTNTILPHVKTDLGSSYIMENGMMLSYSANTSGYGRLGTGAGCVSAYRWYQKQKICALSEIQIYGSIATSSSGYDTGEACRQLDVFKVYTPPEIFGSRAIWLRNVVGKTQATRTQTGGRTSWATVSGNQCVAGLVLFAKPRT